MKGYDPLCSIVMYCPVMSQMLGLLADCSLQRPVCNSNKDIIIIIVFIYFLNFFNIFGSIDPEG